MAFFWVTTYVDYVLVLESASTQNNLETSDVCKSEHFTLAASLLQVGVHRYSPQNMYLLLNIVDFSNYFYDCHYLSVSHFAG